MHLTHNFHIISDAIQENGIFDVKNSRVISDDVLLNSQNRLLKNMDFKNLSLFKATEICTQTSREFYSNIIKGYKRVPLRNRDVLILQMFEFLSKLGRL